MRAEVASAMAWIAVVSDETRSPTGSSPIARPRALVPMRSTLAIPPDGASRGKHLYGDGDDGISGNPVAGVGKSRAVNRGSSP